MSRHTRSNPSGSGDAPPPPPDPNMAQLLRLLREERQAARDERQANMAALQQLVQAATNANQGGGGAGGNEEPRSRLRDFQNTNPPVFSQTKEPLDAEDWLRTMENNLTVAAVGNNEKVLYATHYLAGTARSWWEGVRARLPEGQVLSWAEFSAKFKKAHIPTALIRRMKDEFRHLKQGGMTVVGYLDRFTQLSRYSPEDVDTEEKRKDRFLDGLHDGLQVVLVSMQFPDLESLADATIMMEGKLKMAAENRKRRMMQQGGSSNLRLRPTQPPRPAPQPQRIPYPAPRPNAPTRPVGVPRPAGGVPRNPAVICFGCGQKGHYSTECPNKKNVAPRPNAPVPARGNPGRSNAPRGALGRGATFL